MIRQVAWSKSHVEMNHRLQMSSWRTLEIIFSGYSLPNGPGSEVLLVMEYQAKAGKSNTVDITTTVVCLFSVHE